MGLTIPHSFFLASLLCVCMGVCWLCIGCASQTSSLRTGCVSRKKKRVPRRAWIRTKSKSAPTPPTTANLSQPPIPPSPNNTPWGCIKCPGVYSMNCHERCPDACPCSSPSLRSGWHYPCIHVSLCSTPSTLCSGTIHVSVYPCVVPLVLCVVALSMYPCIPV